MPRSLAGSFAICWGLFFIAAAVTGAALIAFYREGTAERLHRAEAAVTLGCEAIVDRVRFVASNTPRLDWDQPETEQAMTAATLLALRDLGGVEGGLWRTGVGPAAYAYPTYQGGGPKTDVPTAELPRIQAVAELAAERGGAVARRYDATGQALLLRACPVPVAGLAAWTMTRIVLVGGPAYLRAAAALGALTLVLLASAGWLGWLLLGWSRRLRRIEAALASSDAMEDLPRLAATGQRDLDRIVAAVNGATDRVAEARRAAAAASGRAAAAERLAGLGRVAAGVAHEIRNPIAAMRLKAENALATGEPDRMARALRTVLEQVGRLDGVTRDLLGTVRGGAAVDPRPADPRGLLTDRAALFREQAGAAGVTISVADGDSGQAVLDAARLERAIDNLVLNALEATPPGGRIALSTSRRGDALLIAVADTGRGVPEGLRPHLFEPFTTGRPDGTGLGLALVREAVEAHGGTVRALHRDDGTTIEIEIPLRGAAWPPS